MSTYEVSQLQARVYFVVAQHGPIGPTKIGHHLEFSYNQASGSVMRPLRTLVKKGLIKKEAKNKRVVTYSTNHEVPPPLILRGELDEEDKV